MVLQGGIEPPTPGFSVLCSTNWATEAIHYKWRSGRDSNSRPPTWQAGILTNWTTGPLTFFIWLRGTDLNQRPPGYEPDELPLLYPAMYGGERGIWTPAGLASPIGFQDRTLQPLGYFSVYNIKMFWWTRQDSNLWPTGYEPVALTNWATGPIIGGSGGIRTHDLSGMNRSL